MRLSGKLILDGKSMLSASIICTDQSLSFHDRMEKAFIDLCKELCISVPMWFDKNTKELSMCKKTSFFADQFSDIFIYDRFELRIDRL